MCSIGSYFYPHGTYQSSADFSYVPRYINGGCVIGKVWALREAYAFLNFYADSIGDDQMLLARHYQLFPSLYHIDSTQILTMTTHKQYRFNIPSNRLVSSLGIAMIVSPDMELILVNETTGAIVKDIGILHGNNMGSSPIYMMANHTFFTYFQMKYQDLNGTEHHAILQSSAGDLHEFTRKAKELRSKKLRDMWSRVDGKQVLV
ncbi:hypothetical protein EON65_04155 [archaeon]|nr:MAG: hypothetical protein EON65_04155 [archaeon]